MDGKYRIGRHEFESREEWENALKDVKRITAIVERLDIENPKDLLIIYNMIRDGEVTFSSELGAAFYCDISDRMAKSSRRLLRESRRRKKWDSIPASKKQQMFKSIGILCIILALCCFGVYTYYEYSERKAVRKLEELQDQKDISQAVNWYIDRLKNQGATENISSEDASAWPEAGNVAEQRTVLAEYASLHEKYPDFIGWLRIEGSQIDLPVMQTVDNEYYLSKDLDGNDDLNGTLFLDYRADAYAPSQNLIVYGHNMKSGAMFGELKKYLDESYAAEHTYIQFDTIYEKQTYQLIAVCLSEVGYQNEEGTKYYDFIEADSQEEWNAFLKTVQKSAVYDKTQDVTMSDSLLTLSTCNSYVEDGRLFLVAKKIQ